MASFRSLCGHTPFAYPATPVGGEYKTEQTVYQQGMELPVTESLNSFDAKKTLDVNGKSYDYFDINTVPGMEKLPYSLKVLAGGGR